MKNFSLACYRLSQSSSLLCWVWCQSDVHYSWLWYTTPWWQMGWGTPIQYQAEPLYSLWCNRTFWVNATVLVSMLSTWLCPNVTTVMNTQDEKGVDSHAERGRCLLHLSQKAGIVGTDRQWSYTGRQTSRWIKTKTDGYNWISQTS